MKNKNKFKSFLEYILGITHKPDYDKNKKLSMFALVEGLELHDKVEPSISRVHNVKDGNFVYKSQQGTYMRKIIFERTITGNNVEGRTLIVKAYAVPYDYENFKFMNEDAVEVFNGRSRSLMGNSNPFSVYVFPYEGWWVDEILKIYDEGLELIKQKELEEEQKEQKEQEEINQKLDLIRKSGGDDA
jgi:hypothetical protein